MSWRDRLGNLAFNLNAEVVRQQQIPACEISALGDCKSGGEAGCRGVRQQAVNTIFADCKLRVIVIVGVHANAISESGEWLGCRRVVRDDPGDAQLHAASQRREGRIERHH